jgi:hypothetical protein
MLKVLSPSSKAVMQSKTRTPQFGRIPESEPNRLDAFKVSAAQNAKEDITSQAYIITIISRTITKKVKRQPFINTNTALS